MAIEKAQWSALQSVWETRGVVQGEEQEDNSGSRRRGRGAPGAGEAPGPKEAAGGKTDRLEPRCRDEEQASLTGSQPLPSPQADQSVLLEQCR